MKIIFNFRDNPIGLPPSLETFVFYNVRIRNFSETSKKEAEKKSDQFFFTKLSDEI